MHIYSVKSEVIRKATVFSAVIATLISGVLIERTISMPIRWVLYPSPLVIFAVVFYIFDHWLWKTSFIQRLISIPDMTGKWEGKLFRDHNGKSVERDVKMTISQTFTKIAIRFEGQSSESRSISASLSDVPKSDLRLTWTYFAEDKSAHSDRNLYGHGTTMVNVSGGTMSGTYYSTKLNKGRLELRKKNESV